jgi:DNA-binding CsgD family transcriptional regulator/tetratricopeptide (TPR) repeat protein
MDAARPYVCPVLVGRDDLLALAERRIGEVVLGTGRFLVLAGEAGVGKTRLLGAMERIAIERGCLTVGAGAYPSDLNVAGAILIDLARAMARIPALVEAGAALGEALDTAEDGGRDPTRRRRLLVLDAAERIAAASSRLPGPLSIRLEDLHWSDDLTLEVLEALARRVPDEPILVIATYRSDEVMPRTPMRQWRSRLVAQRLVEEIRLPRLSASQTATMTSLLLGSALPTPRDLADAVHRRTDGIPLHVEELLGLLGPDAARRDGVDPGAIEAARVPQTLEDAVIGRMDQRSPAAGAVARAGAVIGRSFDVDLLAEVAGMPPEDLSDPLTELVDHAIFVAGPASGRYGFRHALIADAIAGRIPEPERRRLHARTADAAARRPDVGTSAFLALHHERAGRTAEAFLAAVDGARAAAALSAHAEADQLYRVAVRTMPPDLPVIERARVLEAHGHEAAAIDDNQAADVAYRAAREAYGVAGDRLGAADVVASWVAVRHLLGDDLASRAGQVLAALASLQDLPTDGSDGSARPVQAVRARLLAASAAAHMLDRRLEPALTYGSDAARLAVVAGDRRTEQHVNATTGTCLVFAGEMDRGWMTLEATIASAIADQHEPEAARAYRMLGSSASVLVEYDRAEAWLRDGIVYAEAVERWNDRHYMAAHLAHVLWARGRWDEAEEVARHALADGRGGVTTRVTALHVLGFIELGRDRLTDATAHLEEARALGASMRELQRLGPALWGRAEVALRRGEARSALELADEGRRASAAVEDAAYRFPFLVTGVRAALAADDPGAARRWLEEETGALRQRDLPGARPAIAHGEGLVLLAEGSTGRARARLDAARTGWSTRGRTWEGTWATVDLARAAARSNLRSVAARLAGEAAAVAHSLPAPAIAEAAAAIGASAGGRRDVVDPWAPLTAREFEVARAVARGLTNVGIADALGISRKTASAHVEHILAKLGVGRRAEIAAWVAGRPVLHSAPHGDDREE